MSQETRLTLLEQFRNTVEAFKDRKTVGRIKTEHVVFIPTSLMTESETEANDFIVAARQIRKNDHWGCNVSVNQVYESEVAGLEVVFEFTKDTDFNGIISNLDSMLEKN